MCMYIYAGLLGKHINTETGQWSESLSGVGSNADSFYEYLLKAYLLFRDKEVSERISKLNCIAGMHACSVVNEITTTY